MWRPLVVLGEHPGFSASALGSVPAALPGRSALSSPPSRRLTPKRQQPLQSAVSTLYRAHPPHPDSSLRLQLRPTQTLPVILLLFTEVSSCPWAPLPPPSSGCVVCWGHANRHGALIRRSGVVATPRHRHHHRHRGATTSPPDTRPDPPGGPGRRVGRGCSSSGGRRGWREKAARAPAMTPRRCPRAEGARWPYSE